MGFVSLKENVENGQKKKKTKKNQMILVMSNEHTIQLRSSKKTGRLSSKTRQEKNCFYRFKFS